MPSASAQGSEKPKKPWEIFALLEQHLEATLLTWPLYGQWNQTPNLHSQRTLQCVQLGLKLMPSRWTALYGSSTACMN